MHNTMENKYRVCKSSDNSFVEEVDQVTAYDNRIGYKVYSNGKLVRETKASSTPDHVMDIIAYDGDGNRVHTLKK